jgi:hypothetical protein
MKRAIPGSDAPPLSPALMVGVGATYVAACLFGALALLSPALAWLMLKSGMPWQQGVPLTITHAVGVATAGLVACGSLSAGNVAIGRGLREGARWAWFAGLVTASLYLLTLCFPLGIALAVGLFSKDARARCLPDEPRS